VRRKKQKAGDAQPPAEAVFRSKLWLDDLANSINHVYSSLLYSLGLEFAWRGSVVFQNVKYDNWSALREAFRKFTFMSLQKNAGNSGGSDGELAEVGCLNLSVGHNAA
jgi:hypothetical protein